MTTKAQANPNFTPPAHILDAIERAKQGQSSSLISNRKTSEIARPAPRFYAMEVLQYLCDLQIGENQYVILPTDVFVEEDSKTANIYSQKDLNKKKNVELVGYVYQGKTYYKGTNDFQELEDLAVTAIEDLSKAVAFYQSPPKKRIKQAYAKTELEDIESLVEELVAKYSQPIPTWFYILASSQFLVILILFLFLLFT